MNRDKQADNVSFDMALTHFHDTNQSRNNTGGATAPRATWSASSPPRAGNARRVRREQKVVHIYLEILKSLSSAPPADRKGLSVGTYKLDNESELFSPSFLRK